MAAIGMEATHSEIPADLIEVGSVRGAYGIKGWVRVAPWADGSALLANKRWWVSGTDSFCRVIVEGSRRQGHSIVAKWEGCDSKEDADRARGLRVAVARSDFPRAAEDEYYWADLVGSRVVNRLGEELGHVTGLGDSGAGHWLEIEGDEPRRIPLVGQYVDAIDLEQKVITVDWQKDW